MALQAQSCGGPQESLCVLKEGLCEAGSWLVVEGRVTVKESGSNSSPNTSGLMLVGGGDKADWMRCTQN